MVCFALASLRRPFAPVQSVSNNMTVFVNTIKHQHVTYTSVTSYPIHTPPLMVCFALASRALRRPFAPVQSVTNNTTVFVNTVRSTLRL